MGYIYKITQQETNLSYIGQTTLTIHERWRQHVKEAKEALDGIRLSFPLFHRMIIKYGEESFLVEELEECQDSLLDIREQYWISQFHTYEHGYNQTCGGQNIKELNINKVKKVSCFNLNGEYICTYDSAAEAAKDKHVDASNIRKNCNGKSSHCMGFLWQWGDSNKFTRSTYISRYGKGKKKQILQFNNEGILLNSFSSIIEAAQETGVSKNGISQCCNNKQKKSGGFYWKFDFL